MNHVKKVVEAARVVTLRRLELKRAKDDECSKLIERQRTQALEKALRLQDTAVMEFERALKKAKLDRVAAGGPLPSTDWAGMFRSGAQILGIIRDVVRTPNITRDEVLNKAKNFIDAEFEDITGSKRKKP